MPPGVRLVLSCSELRVKRVKRRLRANRSTRPDVLLSDDENPKSAALEQRTDPSSSHRGGLGHVQRRRFARGDGYLS